MQSVSRVCLSFCWFLTFCCFSLTFVVAVALDLVSDVTAKANTTLASLDKVHRLLWYQSRTMEYTFLRPDREFIRDGTLRKLSRKSLQERTVILVNLLSLYDLLAPLLSQNYFFTYAYCTLL